MIYDVDIYNYDNLISQEKTFIDGFDAAIEEVSKSEDFIIENICTDYEDLDSILGKLKSEIVSQVLEVLFNALDMARTERIVTMIDEREDE